MDYASQSVAELQALVKERGIKCAAKTKPALIKAIEKADAAKAAEASTPMDDAAEEEEPKAASKGRGKRKAAEKKAPAAEEEEEEEEEAPKAKKGKKAAAAPAAAAAAAAPAAAASTKKASYKVDPAVRIGGAAVFEDYDAMLNQTNIGANNNKVRPARQLRHHRQLTLEFDFRG